MIEIYSDRIEITNPGKPLIEPIRFMNDPPISRNEKLATLMRRMNICEERGSGIDKVVSAVEEAQLPAPKFSAFDSHTQTILFAHRTLSTMPKEAKIRACYLHACLKFLQNEYMTNASLRDRFGISKENQSMVSRIINETLESGFIVPRDPASGSRKHASYIPFWAADSQVSLFDRNG